MYLCSLSQGNWKSWLPYFYKTEVKHYNSWESETSYIKNHLLTHGSLKQGLFCRYKAFIDLYGFLIYRFREQSFLILVNLLASYSNRVSKLARI